MKRRGPAGVSILLAAFGGFGLFDLSARGSGIDVLKKKRRSGSEPTLEAEENEDVNQPSVHEPSVYPDS
jgi:hypothetical protein